MHYLKLCIDQFNVSIKIKSGKIYWKCLYPEWNCFLHYALYQELWKRKNICCEKYGSLKSYRFDNIRVLMHYFTQRTLCVLIEWQI